MFNLKVFFPLLFLTFAARADFKELDSADFDFAIQMLAKNMATCWKDPQRRVSIGVDSIKNKTSQSVDKEKIAGSLVEALGNVAKFDVIEDTTAPKVRLVIESQLAEAPVRFQGTFNLELYVEPQNGIDPCKQKLVMTKSAAIKTPPAKTHKGKK